MQAEEPDLFAYSDYRSFLRDWIDARRGRSYQQLAGRVGCSKSLVASIISGRRPLQPHWLHAFGDALGLTGDGERAYFTALVDLVEAADLPRRRAALGRILTTQRFSQLNHVGQSVCRLYSQWYYLAIAELSGCDGFQEDPAWIARALRPPITTAQAAEALDTLIELGLLVRDENDRLTVGAWSSGHDVHDPLVTAALGDLHRELLGLAVGALDTVPAPQRQMEFVTLALPDGKLDEYRALVRRFQEEIIQLAATNTRGTNQVYTISVQLFPVSASTTDGVSR